MFREMDDSEIRFERGMATKSTKSTKGTKKPNEFFVIFVFYVAHDLGPSPPQLGKARVLK